MKRCMNESGEFVDESLEGIYLAHGEDYRKGNGNRRALVRREQKQGKVAVVTGGGYGHLPLFLGYVGKGLCDGAAVGNVFTSPSCGAILDAARSTEQGKGVLFLFGNYFGDGMNFEMASEMLAAEGIRTATVKGTDDVASAPKEEKKRRRGIAGILYAYRLAGASAERGDALEEVERIARKAVENTGTYGAAFSSCTLPGTDRTIFEIGEDEMELGMGIHGEPGARRGPLRKSREIAEELCGALTEDMGLKQGDRVSVLVNGLGMTSREELYILYKDVWEQLEKKGIRTVGAHVGEYATSLEMAGVSVSLLKLDEELERLLGEEAETPFWKI